MGALNTTMAIRAHDGRSLDVLRLMILCIAMLAATSVSARADVVDEPSTADAGAATATAGEVFGSDLERAIALMEPSVVFLGISVEGYVHDGYDWLNDGYPYALETHCSGTIIGSTGYILTAAHCVDPSEFRGPFIEAGVQEWLVNGWHLDADGAEAISPAALSDVAWFDWRVEGTEPGSPLDVTVDVALSTTAAAMTGTDVARARVIDLLPFGQGDVAILKVEVSGLPAAPLATEVPNVGADIVAAGYPASVDAVTDPDLNAAYKDGRISQRRTNGEGSLPVIEISAAMSGGMSGGPTFDLRGEIVGVNSYGIVGETQQFNFVSPVQLARELAMKNGLDLQLDPTSQAYRDGVAALAGGDTAAAVEAFEAVLASVSGHPDAARLLDLAREATVVDPPEPPTNGDGTEEKPGREDSDPPVIESRDVSVPLVTLVLLLGLTVVGAGVAIVVVGRRAASPTSLPGSAPAPSPVNVMPPPPMPAGFAADQLEHVGS